MVTCFKSDNDETFKSPSLPPPFTAFGSAWPSAGLGLLGHPGGRPLHDFWPKKPISVLSPSVIKVRDQAVLADPALL